MTCPTCAAVNDADANFCSNCGTPLPRACPVCSAPYEPGARFCNQCGTALVDGAVPGLAPDAASAAPATAGPPTAAADEAEDLSRYVPEELLRKIRAARSGQTMRGERRTVTMLFADIQGSTAAAETLDPEEWAEIINGAFGRLIAPVYRYEGTLARLQGDAILAFFGAPIAHEDDPVRAVRAGLEIVSEIGPYAAEVEQRHGVSMDVRVGINTGLVVVGEVGSDLRVEYTALGDAINVAARMEQTADAGTVRVTEDTLALLGDTFASDPIGPVEVKGKSEPVQAHRVLRVAPEAVAPGAVDGALVGREQELALLGDVASRLERGLGGICTIIGEAGVGKSRLLAAMHAQEHERVTIADRWDQPGQIAWLLGRARSYERNVPHATFADLLRRWWGLDDAEDGFATIQAATARALGGADDDLAGFLAALVGVAVPEAQQELIEALSAPSLHGRTADAVARYLAAEATGRPIGIVLDDVHWCDAVSLALIENLMPLTDTAAFGLLLMMRPNREEPAWRIIEVATRDHGHRHVAVELGALPSAATEELLATLVADLDVPPAVRQAIIERSGGNPLFVEEIVRSFDDAGGAALDDAAVPRSLSSLLTSRLDRLEEGARHVAQVASVIGREFDRPTVEAVVDDQADLAAAVSELVRRGILEERRRLPEPAYAFRHPLIRETAYSTVLLRTRRQLHGRIARHLEQAAPEAAQEIATHYLEANDPVAAFPWLVRAGQRAVRAMALSDAIRYFGAALESPPVGAPEDLVTAAHEGLGEAFSLVPDLTRAATAYQSLFDFGRDHGNAPVQVAALNHLGFSTAALGGDVGEALGYLEQAKELAQEAGDELGLAQYHMNSCFVVSLRGDLDAAVVHDDETARIGQQAGNEVVRLVGLIRKCANLALILRLDEAMVAYEEGREVAAEIGSAELAAVLDANGLAQIHLVRGELVEAQEIIDRCVAVLDRHSSFYAAHVHTRLATIAVLTGQYELALGSFAAADRLGVELPQAWGRALGLSGQALMLTILGSDQELQAMQELAVEQLSLPSGDFLATTVWLQLADAALRRGDAGRARELVRVGLASSSVSSVAERPALHEVDCRAALALEDVEGATAALEEARTFVVEHDYQLHGPDLLLLDGLVARADGRDDDATTSLGEAIRAAAEAGRRPLRLEALCALADLRTRAGEPAEGEALLERGRAILREMAGEIADEGLRASFVATTERSLALRP